MNLPVEKKEKLSYFLNRAEELMSSIKLVYEMESRDESQYNKIHAFSSHKTFAVQQKNLALDIMREFPDANFLFYDTDSMPEAFRSVYAQRKNVMDGVLIETGKMRAFLKSKAGQKQNEIEGIISLITNKLRSIVRATPQKEGEVQDKVEDLLIGKGYSKGTDFDRETGRVKTGVKESVPDFVFKTLNLAIEVKLVKDKYGPTRITEEMNADITSYGTGYDNIFFVVYDVGGHIQNIDEFKLKGLHVYTEVVKH